jgi:hypothetical protein
VELEEVIKVLSPVVVGAPVPVPVLVAELVAELPPVEELGAPTPVSKVTGKFPGATSEPISSWYEPSA